MVKSKFPETVEADVAWFQLGFKDGVEWTRPIGEAYRRTECQVCGESIGTCEGRIRFVEIKMAHRDACPIICGFRDCVDCNKRSRP